ncbi:hypothetical protein PTSG_03171 [Salpingoeca rosetta]|uniref:AB hydrolase-1 domain-containing protein n=1 Tax=Salpingoeca rosetta (strain ATCC 50818 / BSB-021) TaxID=946362 RepID=F2U4F5_SALR5|nr:uncharacterized protein PTSG_03171 [Salpingoeca rosetta]EGD82521.1 hypothetical protein PTSG_03171 [Salpingoeca rosetta]|eukprot:XP_004995757.1 hypothetical protein PTSG_03171 [Salpingoeca rosetta]
MGVLLRLLGAGVVGGGVAVVYAGVKAQEERERLNEHEARIDAFLARHPRASHQRFAVDWSAPRMPDYNLQAGGFSHLYFDLTVDQFTLPAEEGSAAGTRLQQPVLFIAPPSFVSSRTIFFPMAEASFSNFGVTEVPSYGLNKQTLRPTHYNTQLIDSGLTTMPPSTKGVAVVATGHAAITALRTAQQNPELFSCLVLLNPTFRGPLPTVKFDLESKGKTRESMLLDYASSAIWKLYQLPYVGDAIHNMFTSREHIKKQLHSHVFENPEAITDDVITRNQAFAKEGPILGKCAFLVGKADPVASRDELAALLRGGCRVPTLVVMGYGAPETSRADLQPLHEAVAAGDSKLRVVETRGALRSYEEFPLDIGSIVKSFIQDCN